LEIAAAFGCEASREITIGFAAGLDLALAAATTRRPAADTGVSRRGRWDGSRSGSGGADRAVTAMLGDAGWAGRRATAVGGGALSFPRR
jgi:hypothetical protein